MNKIIFFSFGLLIGIAPQAWQYLSLVNLPVTPLEVSLGQLLYGEWQLYADSARLDQVLSVVQDFYLQKRSLREEIEQEEPLISYAVEKVEREAAKNLIQAEALLHSISCLPNITAVVPDRVYIEVLERGEGEVITANDVVKLHFKEYTPDQVLVKDTGVEKPFTIPLVQTIKGFYLGIEGARIGERRKIYVHPDFGFGKIGRKGTNQLLIYEVTLIGKVPTLP